MSLARWASYSTRMLFIYIPAQQTTLLSFNGLHERRPRGGIFDLIFSLSITDLLFFFFLSYCSTYTQHRQANASPPLQFSNPLHHFILHLGRGLACFILIDWLLVYFIYLKAKDRKVHVVLVGWWLFRWWCCLVLCLPGIVISLLFYYCNR